MHKFIISLVYFLLVFTTLVYAAEQTPDPSHGIAYPEGWQYWGTIAVSHRIDNNTIRVILGQANFFKKYHISFDGLQETIRILPHIIT